MEYHNRRRAPLGHRMTIPPEEQSDAVRERMSAVSSQSSPSAS